MRTGHRIGIAFGCAWVLASAAPARAQQLDTNPKAPNVLLLLDNSGSMERMIDGSVPEQSGNACNIDPNTGAILPSVKPPTPNRWGQLIRALTGTFQNNYNCVSMPRTAGSPFAQEYQIDGVQPYDTGYYLNYHRPVFVDSSTSTPTACVLGPGGLPGAQPGHGVGKAGTGFGNLAVGAGGSAGDFPTDSLVLRPYAPTSSTTVVANAQSGPCSKFPSNQYTAYQYQDGAIPSSTSLMRFGLMTFDQDPSAAIGVSMGNPATVNAAGFSDPVSSFNGAFAGMWSYFPGWNTGGTCPYTGMPPNCTAPQMFAVGSRNPDAPPWEGRMMPFPSTDDLGTQESNNLAISNVILATRPYGATPLDGMMTDAEYYLWKDPKGPEQSDPYVHCGERPQYIIVLTDGVPNLDMRPDCATAGSSGNCPFPDDPVKIAKDLYQATGGTHSVTTFVLGFSVSAQENGIPAQCSQLVSAGSLGATCSQNLATSDPNYACCELQKIAMAGSNNETPAFFADNPADLQKALSMILAKIAAKATSRTTPAFSAGEQNALDDPSTPTTASEAFLASFNPTPGGPWTGDVTRVRNQCTFASGSYSVNPAFDATQGDDFGANLNSHAGNQRIFIAMQPAKVGSTASVAPQATIRPYVSPTVADGIGQYGATTWAGTAADVIPNITPAALGITQPCTYNSTQSLAPKVPGLSTTDCATMTLDYIFGQPTFTSNPGDFPFVSRYSAALGDIYHAALAVVGPPSTPIQDPSYLAFQEKWANRDSIVYAVTNDGLLHAFWSDETKLENNERWAMLLPEVMPSLYPTYPSSHSLLLDGSLVTKDVVWERSVSSAGDGTVWHTMLVAGFGSQNRGYYAVDVTNPDATSLPSGVPQTSPPPPGPQFRWQMTTMPSTNYPIFGAHSATPAITTLYMDPDGLGAREIGVAILPGGSDPPPKAIAECARAQKTSDSQPQDESGFRYRANVRCWGSSGSPSDPVNGRSLAIVRLDTGEILQVFARLADVQASYPNDTLLAKNRIRDTALDSPMTGTPIVYPSDVGADATKIFVSDSDGTIWKFDVSNTDPTKWTGELFLDLYNGTADGNQNTSWADGQPLTVTPTLTLDPAGELVINAATGTTDTFDSSGINFVYSITEKVQGSTPKLRAFVNWYIGSPLTPPSSTSTPPSPQATLSSPALLPGERVAGPMTVFDGKLYFATYAAAPTPTLGQPVTSCAASYARIWGLDFVKPADANCNSSSSTTCDRSIGGIPGLQLPPPQPAGTFVADVTPSATDSTLNNVVIPGLAINETPACATGGTPAQDTYVAGAMHTGVSNFTPGSFSLLSTVGQTNPNGPGARTLTTGIAPPMTPTMIDSWAAVIE